MISASENKVDVVSPYYTAADLPRTDVWVVGVSDSATILLTMRTLSNLKQVVLNLNHR